MADVAVHAKTRQVPGPTRLLSRAMAPTSQIVNPKSSFFPDTDRRIQIWTALIALLLLQWLHHLSKAGWSLSNLAALLRLNLLAYRDVRQWLDDPFQTPPSSQSQYN